MMCACSGFREFLRSPEVRTAATLFVAAALLACDAERTESGSPAPSTAESPARSQSSPPELPAPELVKLGRFAEAETALRGAIERASGSDPRTNPASRARLRHLLALSLSGQGRPAEALVEIELAARLAGDNPEVQRAFGSILASCGRTDDAVPRFRKAIELAEAFRAKTGLDVPDLHRWRYALAQALRRSGNDEEAAREIDIYERSQTREIELRSLARRARERGTAAAHCDHGKALRAAGELQRSAEAFRAAISVDETSANAQLGLAAVLTDDAASRTPSPFRTELLKLAKSHAKLGLAVEESPGALLAVARVEWLRGEVDSAEALFARALALAGDEPGTAEAIVEIRTLPLGEAAR